MGAGVTASWSCTFRLSSSCVTPVQKPLKCFQTTYFPFLRLFFNPNPGSSKYLNIHIFLEDCTTQTSNISYTLFVFEQCFKRFGLSQYEGPACSKVVPYVFMLGVETEWWSTCTADIERWHGSFVHHHYVTHVFHHLVLLKQSLEMPPSVEKSRLPQSGQEDSASLQQNCSIQPFSDERHLDFKGLVFFNTE